MQRDRMYQLLFEAVRQESVAEVQRAASAIFESAVSVTDTAFRVLSADLDPGSTEDMLEKGEAHTYVSGELLKLFREHNLIANLTARPGETIVVDWGYFKQHPHLTTGIFWEGRILGSVTVLVDSATVTPEQHAALQACADALALVMHKSDAGKVLLNADRDHFISRLFAGLLTGRELGEAVRQRWFAQSKRYLVMATQMPLDDAWQHRIASNPAMLSQRREGVVYLLANAQSEDLAALCARIEDRGYRCGLSYSFSDPLQAVTMAKQAAIALNYANRYGRGRAEWPFPECALDILVRGSDIARSAAHPGILDMERYDLENNTRYLETLRVWLESRMDYSVAAGALHLHRNSLYYRMQRIRELFCIDIDDMNTDVQLYLSLCVGRN